jgi:hypothetical protein
VVSYKLFTLLDPAAETLVSGGGNYEVEPWYPIQKFIRASGSPGAATLVSPSGNINTSVPTYNWNAVPMATSYQLWVNDASAAPKIQQWYTVDQASCASGTGTCTINPSEALAPGACQWWIQTRNSAGDGPWSDMMQFTVTANGIRNLR